MLNLSLFFIKQTLFTFLLLQISFVCGMIIKEISGKFRM